MTETTRKRICAAIGLTVLALGTSSVAEANTIGVYSISGSFDDGGSIAGSFTIDWTSDTVTSMGLTTSAGPNPALPGSTYTNPVGFFEIVSGALAACQINCILEGRPGGSGNEFLGIVFHVGSNDQLTFLQTFSAPGAAATSGEVSLAGSRLMTAATITGDVSATPLPGALPLFATALGALGLFEWRRKKRAAPTV